MSFAFSALTLLVGRQEEHMARKQESRALSRKEPPRDAGIVSPYKMNIESFKYDRPTQLQPLVISAGRPLFPLMLSACDEH